MSPIYNATNQSMTPITPVTMDDLYRAATKHRTNMMVAPVGGLSGSYQQTPSFSGMNHHPTRVEMLAARLRLDVGEMYRKLEGLYTTHIEGSDKVFVTFVGKGELVVFEDSAGMYPSDALVTSLRLCL